MTQFEKTLKYLKDSAKKNMNTADYLFKGRRYDSCLFFCHLALEKLIKSIVVEKTDSAAPFIHDLVKLSQYANIELDKIAEGSLEKITDFNIAGRYDDEKQAFNKLCTKTYAQKYLKISKELFVWLENNYLKK